MASASEDSIEYIWHNGLPHIRWEALDEAIASRPADEHSAFLTQAIEQWLHRLAAATGREAGVLKHGEMFLLYASPDDQPQRLLRWSAGALARITTIVGDHRTPEMIGPRVIVLFDDDSRYYDYIDRFFPEEGHYGASAGICISSEYFHIAVGPDDVDMRQRALAHELTHLALAPLPLPPWLDEGIAQMMEGEIANVSFFSVDAEIVERHHALWREHGLDVFWAGESFGRPDEMCELSYHLAEVLTRNIQADHRGAFINFLAAAHWQDAGDAAARTVLGRSLAEIVSDFLGEGPWHPRDPWDPRQIPTQPNCCLHPHRFMRVPSPTPTLAASSPGRARRNDFDEVLTVPQQDVCKKGIGMTRVNQRRSLTIRCAAAGAVVGLVLALIPIAFGYAIAPRIPGPFELALQVVFVLLGACVVAGIGAAVGFVVSRLLQKSRNAERSGDGVASSGG